jgi:hypothetical protein
MLTKNLKCQGPRFGFLYLFWLKLYDCQMFYEMKDIFWISS